MIKNILLFFVVTLTTVLQAQNVKIDSLDEKIKSTIGQQPDSAKYYLLRFIAYEAELSDSIMAYAYTRLADSYGQLGQADSARIYFDKGILKAQNHPSILGRIYKQLAQAERVFSNYDRAFDALENAEKVYRENNDLEGVGLVYVERASSYAYMSQEKKAIELLKEAIALFEEIGGSVNMIFAKQELANTYLNNENFNFAKDLYEAILPDVKRETTVINYYFTLVNYAHCLTGLSEYDKAEQAYIEALNFFKENNNETFYFYVLNKLGVIYHNKKDYQKAVPYLKDAFLGMYKLQSVYLKSVTVDYLNLLNDIGDYNTSLNVINQIEHIEKSKKIQYNDWTQVSFLENVKETYVKKGNYEKALEVHEKMQVLKDSLSVERNEVELKKIQEEYQNEYQRKENKILAHNNQLLKKQNHNKQTIIILISLLSFTLISIGLFAYQKHKKEAKLKAEAVNSLKQAKRYLEEKLDAEAALHNERKKALEHSERELVAKTMKMANFKNKIANIIENDRSEMNTQKLKRNLTMLLKEDKNWEFFIKRFVEVHPDFLSDLKQKYPQLTKSELDFCVLIKLRLSNKEIGNLLNIDHKSVISKKYRLRKKINQSESDLSIEELIEQF